MYLTDSLMYRDLVTSVTGPMGMPKSFFDGFFAAFFLAMRFCHSIAGSARVVSMTKQRTDEAEWLRECGKNQIDLWLCHRKLRLDDRESVFVKTPHVSISPSRHARSDCSRCRMELGRSKLLMSTHVHDTANSLPVQGFFSELLALS
jgi:hypothetical protein